MNNYKFSFLFFVKFKIVFLLKNRDIDKKNI